MRRAGIITCLFLFHLSHLLAQDWKFNPRAQEMYNLVLNLHTSDALQVLQTPATAQDNYVVSLAQTLELILTEDGEKYQAYHDAYEGQLGRRSKSSSLKEDLFLQASLRLHWAFVYLKFGHEFDAAWNLRQAYLNVKDCREKFPDYLPINKVSGILEIMIGSIPEKYNWVLNIMGMEGSVTKGLAELDTLRKSNTSLSLETNIIYALIQCYVLHHAEEALQNMKELLANNPDNPLITFVGAAIALKSSKSEYALELLLNLDKINTGLPITFAYYLLGEAYLHKGDYKNALSAYRWFVNNFKGQNYIKDGYYKIAISYWLNGNQNDALNTFKIAKAIGKESSEADKYAARSLVETDLPNIPLSKVRYYTDGGYYDLAAQTIDSIRSTEIPGIRDQIEYFYRKARLAHKQQKTEEAKEYYQETINNTPKENTWYFAPNSCLQLGYIALQENDTTAATNYFEKARSYQKHPYKNSIDSEAKAALGQLKDRK